MSSILPVILSGGSGTRLWPLSREAYPKQFLPLTGERTMLQATWLRVADVAAHPPIVVANESHRFVAAEQLQQAGTAPSAILLEPIGRNTAPAIAAAALEARRNGDDPLLLVLPSDHLINDIARFHQAIAQAAAIAEQGKLVTFGIQPTAPETGYGYIKAVAGDGPRAIERFVEKPDLATAETYVASGEYYWNSGMFLFRASRYLEELERLQPQILAACRTAWEKARRDTDFIRLDADAFKASPSDSIDYAVMEKTGDAAVVPLDAGWSDVGSWTALRDVSEQDADGNAHRGDVIAIDCRNTFAYGDRRVGGRHRGGDQ
jgi:mannose-1-phosphate guanylyltransferase/mannose-6-phosphate isomerase